MRILGASVHENSNGQYVKIAVVEVAEGEHQGFYNRDYQNQQSEDRKDKFSINLTTGQFQCFRVF